MYLGSQGQVSLMISSQTHLFASCSGVLILVVARAAEGQDGGSEGAAGREEAHCVCRDPGTHEYADHLLVLQRGSPSDWICTESTWPIHQQDQSQSVRDG